jgi:aminoglycoside phosphotransferase
MGAFGQDNFLSSQQLASPAANSAPLFGKEALAEKALELTTPEFIESRIIPLVRASLNGHGTSCVAQVVQNNGTGRLTLRYDFGPENVLFAKMYVDELGTWCSEVNRALWNTGFNGAGRYRVPEPIGFLADQKLLVMRGVPGKALGTAFDGDTTIDLVDGSREAAEWLAALHRSSLRMGAPDRDWDSLKLFRLASRLIKAVASHPEKLDVVRELMDLLDQRTAKLPANRKFVLTHGRYHHDHVFLSPEATGVIDLDRCRPSDPAKDAAEFVRVFRMTAFKEAFDMDRAEQATAAFLDTYIGKVPEAASSLGCYWATFVFHSLLGGIKKGRSKGKKSWEDLMEFYVSEMMRALEFGR